MRENRAKLRLLRGSRIRLHLGQIRPHGLATAHLNHRDPRITEEHYNRASSFGCSSIPYRLPHRSLGLVDCIINMCGSNYRPHVLISLTNVLRMSRWCCVRIVAHAMTWSRIKRNAGEIVVSVRKRSWKYPCRRDQGSLGRRLRRPGRCSSPQDVRPQTRGRRVPRHRRPAVGAGIHTAREQEPDHRHGGPALARKRRSGEVSNARRSRAIRRMSTSTSCL